MNFGAAFGKSRLGLEISGDALRLAEVQSTGRQLTLRAVAERRLPAGLVSGGQIPDPKALGAEIREAFRSQPLHTRRVVFGIPSSLVLCRSLTLPPASKGALAALVEYGVQTDLSVPFPDPVYDYLPPPRTKAAGPRPVLVVAAPSQSVSALAAAVRAGGLTPTAAEIPALALLRMLALGPALAPDATTVIVELEAEVTAIHFVRAGHLVHSHNQSRGPTARTSPVPKAIAETGDTQRLIRDTTGELEQAMRFYLYGLNGREAPIDRIWVAGHVAELSLIADALGREIDLPVEPLALPAALRLARGVTDDVQPFATAAGLALWGRVLPSVH